MKINSLNSSMSRYGGNKPRLPESSNDDPVIEDVAKPAKFVSQTSKKSSQSKKGLPWYLTEDYKNESQFVIIPFSRLFNIWTTTMIISTAYFLFMVPYQLALDYQIYEEAGLSGLIPDIFFNLIFCADMFLRSRLAFVRDQRGGSDIITDLDQI
jgi:hypothetical protein